MGYQKGKVHDFHYEYDFSVSGGAVGAISLENKGINALESGMIITDFKVVVETTLTSGGSATVTFGNAGDLDGYAADFFADAAADFVFGPGAYAGALVWDDTNDHVIPYKISSSANAIPKIEVGTAALTAGKFQVYIKALKV